MGPVIGTFAYPLGRGPFSDTEHGYPGPVFLLAASPSLPYSALKETIGLICLAARVGTCGLMAASALPPRPPTHLPMLIGANYTLNRGEQPGIATNKRGRNASTCLMR